MALGLAKSRFYGRFMIVDEIRRNGTFLYDRLWFISGKVPTGSGCESPFSRFLRHFRKSFSRPDLLYIEVDSSSHRACVKNKWTPLARARSCQIVVLRAAKWCLHVIQDRAIRDKKKNHVHKRLRLKRHLDRTDIKTKLTRTHESWLHRQRTKTFVSSLMVQWALLWSLNVSEIYINVAIRKHWSC